MYLYVQRAFRLRSEAGELCGEGPSTGSGWHHERLAGMQLNHGRGGDGPGHLLGTSATGFFFSSCVSLIL